MLVLWFYHLAHDNKTISRLCAYIWLLAQQAKNPTFRTRDGWVEWLLINRNASSHSSWLKLLPSHILNQTTLLLQLPLKEWVECVELHSLVPAACSAEHGPCAYKPNQSCLDVFWDQLLPAPTRGDWRWSVNLCTPPFPARITHIVCMTVSREQLLGKNRVAGDQTHVQGWCGGPGAELFMTSKPCLTQLLPMVAQSPSADDPKQSFQILFSQHQILTPKMFFSCCFSLPNAIYPSSVSQYKGVWSWTVN